MIYWSIVADDTRKNLTANTFLRFHVSLFRTRLISSVASSLVSFHITLTITFSMHMLPNPVVVPKSIGLKVNVDVSVLLVFP